MVLVDYKYLMIDSGDFWGFDDSTFEEDSNWWGKVFIVPQEKVEADPSLISSLNLMPCAMFFYTDHEDDQKFTPTNIKVDEERMIAVVNGVQKRVGEDIRDEVRPLIFKLNSLAPPYKNMNEYKKVTLGRFNVANMIFSNEDAEFQKPKDRLEDLTNYLEAFTEEEDEEVVADAESFNAETLERMNPTIVEGAEDIKGAESETFKSSNHDANFMNADGCGCGGGNCQCNAAEDGVFADTEIFGDGVNENVVGQEYAGRVIGQDAEDSVFADTEIFGDGVNENVVGQEYAGRVLGQDAEQSAFYPNGDGRNFGNVTPDGQYEPLGANAEGIENDILSAEYNTESNEVTITTLQGEEFTMSAESGLIKNAEGVFNAEESEALSAEDLTIVMNAAGYVPSGEWGSMNPEEANQNYMWEFRNAEEVPSGEWGSMNPEEANQNYMWEFRNAEHEAQGYDDRDDESIGERDGAKKEQSLKDRRDESKGMTDSIDPHHPFDDVGTMEADTITQEGVLDRVAQNTRELLEDRDTDIVSLVQDAPLIRDFRLSGWAASALVLGTAWVFGRRSKAKSHEVKDAEIEVANTIGVVGGGSDFGQDPVMIEAEPEHRFWRKEEQLPSSAQHNPLRYRPL